MRGKRKARRTQSTAKKSGEPARYVRWRNETGRLLEPLKFDGVTISDWTPWRVVTLSPDSTRAAEAAGLTRIGLAAP